MIEYYCWTLLIVDNNIKSFIDEYNLLEHIIIVVHDIVEYFIITYFIVLVPSNI